MVRIAHCTDFSKNAKKALEAILFNFWSFEISIDIYHLVEGDYDEAVASLASYKTELTNSHGSRVGFTTHLFAANQKERLISEINAERFFGNLVGLEGKGESAGMGSFLAELYKSYLGSMTIVPYCHDIKIENKVLVAVEYNRLEEIYILVKFRGFLNFQFSKLVVLVRVEGTPSPAQVLAVETILGKILPSLKIELLVYDFQGCDDFIEYDLKRKKLDYYILFKDDYFDNCIYNLILNKTSRSTYKERVIRINSSEEELLKLKNNESSVNQLKLRQD